MKFFNFGGGSAHFGLSQEERDKIAPEDFAKPPDGYPCDTQAHLEACATLLGKAPEDEQAAIKKLATAMFQSAAGPGTG